MSSFGAVPLNVPAAHIDYLVSSANKCIEGVPGFSFVIARRKALAATRDWARSLSLDLGAQLEGLERNGQFRFTPPTHTLLAFHQALRELEVEGGVPGRHRRYAANHAALVAGMDRLGFRRYLDDRHQSPIITSFHYPADERFDFETFYGMLKERGMVIYPGKVGTADCFRIGTIGRVFPADIESLLSAIENVTEEMGFDPSPTREMCPS
jgi:2-aminoethylphosphonate-pyruvate transaminase